MNQEIRRGDIWWADVPGDKLRPVIVLTRDRFVARLISLIVAPITTTIRDIPTEVVLDTEDGLSQLCAASFDNIFTLHRSRFATRIGHLTDQRLIEVCRAYRFAAGC